MLSVVEKRPIFSQVLWRSLWAVLLCAHAPAWFGSWSWLWTTGEPPHLLRGVLLTLTQALFILKLWDVAWLRLPATRRAWIAMTVGVALLHAGVMHRAITQQADEAVDVWAVVLIGGGLAAAGASLLKRIAHHLAGGWLRRFGIQTQACVHLVLNRIVEIVSPPRYLLLARACRVNRAPPRF